MAKILIVKLHKKEKAYKMTGEGVPGEAPRAANDPFKNPKEQKGDIYLYFKISQKTKKTMNIPNKINTIRIRLSNEQYEWLFKTSKERNVTVSQLLRDIVKGAMETQ